MTVNTATSTATYTGNSVTAVFSVPFYFLVDTDVQVQQRFNATGVISTLMLGTDYTLTGAGVVSGGTLTLSVVPGTGDTIYLSRNVSAVQQTAYPVNSPFPAASHERALDRLTMLAQQILAKLSFGLFRSPLTAAYDAGGNTIGNVAAAVAAADVPTLAQTQQIAAGAAGGIVPGLIATYSDLASTASGKGAALVGYLTGTVKSFLDSLAQTGASVGSALIGFLQLGTSAVARTVQDKLREKVSVKDFGATGDGSTDDTTAIQAAMNYLAVLGYGRLYFPKGTYKVSAALTVSFNGVVFGDGVGSSVITTNAAAANIFSVNYSGYVEITGLEFATSVTKTAGAAIQVNGLSGSASIQTRIHHNKIQAHYYGIDMANASYWSIAHNFIGESVMAGVRVDNTQNFDAGDNIIVGNVIQKTAVTASSAGILHVGSGGTKVIGNKILGHDRGYALIPRVGATSVIDTQVIGNSFENGNMGVYLATPNASTSIGQVVISGNQISEATAGMSITGACSGVVVNGNQIACNTASVIGVYIDISSGSPAQVNVTGNQISGNSSTGSIGIYGGGGAGLPNINFSNNYISGVVTPYSSIKGIITNATFTFATLPAAANGSIVYCSDGTVANPVAGSGTGCIAKRLNGVWVGN